MIARRNFVVLGVSALAPLRAFAQAPRPKRIGYLAAGSKESDAVWLAAFRKGMADLNWAEGSGYVIDARYANGVSGAIDALAAEFIATQPDLLLAPGDGAIGPLLRATKTIPVVSGSASDPVGTGFAASLRQPGGNFTGLTSLNRELSAKRLQLLKEAFPRTARVAVLYEPDSPQGILQVIEAEKAASNLKLQVRRVELRNPKDIDTAIKNGIAAGAQAYVVASSFLMSTHRKAIADGLMRAQVPAIHSMPGIVEEGGLFSYLPSYEDNFRRAAAYVDKIFKGAKPGELPIQQPLRFEFIVNMKTASAMGVKFPQTILLQATRVIE